MKISSKMHYYFGKQKKIIAKKNEKLGAKSWFTKTHLVI